MKKPATSRARYLSSRKLRAVAGLLALAVLPTIPDRALFGQSPVDTASAHLQPPAGPLLRPAPEFSQWTISFTYEDDQRTAARPSPAPATPARPRQVRTTRTRQLIREVVIDTAGKQTETWFTGREQYIKPPGENLWRVSANSPSESSNDRYHTEALPPDGFRNLEWINAQSYAGTLKYRGDSLALVFIPAGVGTAKFDAKADLKSLLATQKTVCCVDAVTRLPILVKRDEETRTFEFGPPPTEMQKLPADLAQQLKTADDTRTRLGAPALQPF